jgi:hypothetical protein
VKNRVATAAIFRPQKSGAVAPLFITPKD